MAANDCVDLLIIGGGVNGAGIARDAAGRNLKVALVEQSDLASATSSSSTKLIHGGLRYLEFFEFGLVRAGLIERERLLQIAPHIIRPMQFILPHVAGLRPRWQIRMGLFFYDHIGGRKRLPASRGVRVGTGKFGKLRPGIEHGFAYADCWVDDSRLVVLNAVDAAQRGAAIHPRTRFISADVHDGIWQARCEDRSNGAPLEIRARAIVNAAGPWVEQVLRRVPCVEVDSQVRLVKGSHIVVPRLFEGEHAFMLQNPDGRIVFAIPYEESYTLVGTTDVPYEDDPAQVKISTDETLYLCNTINGYFGKSITPTDVHWTYAGVRPLLDDESANASKVTRDYRLELAEGDRHPMLLSVFGGKLTTYRRLAEMALSKLQPQLGGAERTWTDRAALPGGDLPRADFAAFLTGVRRRWPFLPENVARRMARAYGTRLEKIIGSARSMADLGEHFGAGLTRAEVDYLVAHEWARTAEDILWRRTKLGLHLSALERERLEQALAPGIRGLRLTDISYRVGSQTWLYDLNLTLVEGAINVLLGATLAGKTTLLRIMAGLDRPPTGRLSSGQRDLTGVPVRERNVAMVYQQFINYPSLTVYENIASPLRIARRSKAEIKARVGSLAESLRLTQFLSRYPAELSGGQQQRTALARALAKDAELLLLDEPLVNLDYKLREELREELAQLFAQRHTTVVYATTEPQEALQLGGHTAVLNAGRLLQFGPTAEVFKRPATLAAARAFSDPPLNVLNARIDRDRGALLMGDDIRLSLPPQLAGSSSTTANDITVGIRAHEFSLSRATPLDAAITGRVDLAEISGSETFVHLTHQSMSLVAQLPGVHKLSLSEACTLYVDPANLYGFDAHGRLLFAPEH